MSKNKKLIRNVGIVVVLLALITGIVLWNLPTDAEQKILFTADFNKGNDGFGNSVYTGQVSEFSWEQDGGIDDSGCLKIESHQDNDARHVIELDVLPETHYRISAWIRTENVPEVSSAVGGNISVLNTFHKAGNLCGTQDWTKVDLYGVTDTDQSTIKVCLRLGFYSGVNTGTVWFDNVEVEQLAEKPTGVQVVPFKNAMSNSSSSSLGGYEQESVYWDVMKVGGLIVTLAAVIFMVMYRYGKREDDLVQGALSEKKGLSLPVSIGILIALGLIVRLILSVTAPQCSIDVGLFKYWGQQCVEDGIPSFYANAEQYSLDYPPLYIYFLWFNTLLAQALNLVGTVGYTLLIKLPSMLADCVIAFLLYKMCDKRMNRKWILFIVSIWLFNPMVLLDSAAWGQVESLQALPIVIMLYCILKKRLVPASVALAFAVILKPQGIFLIPILGFAWLHRLIRDREMSVARKFGSMFGCVGAFVGTITVVALPFGILQKPNFFSWLVNLYVGTANGYKGATVNSYNFYYLLGENWTNDSEPWLLGWSFFQWGMLFIVVICLLAGALYLFGKMDQGSPFLIASMLVYAVTMFGPRMHERYFFPCIILLLVAAIYANNRLLLWLYAGISAVNFLSVLSVMMGLEAGGLLKDAGAPSSIYGWYYWAGEALHRQWIAGFNLLFCIILVIITICYVAGNAWLRSEQNRIWKLEDEYEEISMFE